MTLPQRGGHLPQRLPRQPREGCKRHRHTFTGLWSHFGKFGPQDVHIHWCFDDDCGRVLIGEGRTCGGPTTPHRRKTL